MNNIRKIENRIEHLERIRATCWTNEETREIEAAIDVAYAKLARARMGAV